MSDILPVDVYIEFMRRSSERQRFSYYAPMGTLMERYRETRDESLIEVFKSMFKKELRVKGLWIDKWSNMYDLLDCTTSSNRTTPNNIYRKTEHQYHTRLYTFETSLMSYQGKGNFTMSDSDIQEIEDYFAENYEDNTNITRTDVIKVSMILRKNIRGNENRLLVRINLNALNDIEHLKEDIIEDFKAFSEEFDRLAKLGLVTDNSYIHKLYCMFY